MPITVLELSDEEVAGLKSRESAQELFAKLRPDLISTYEGYNPHYWKIDTPSKERKYGLVRMLAPNAVSSVTNVKKEKDTNCVFFYLYNKKLIVSPWNGLRSATTASTDSRISHV